MDIKRILQLHKSLLGGTALLGLGSIAAGVLAGPFFGAVANFTAGMVGNNLGALVDKLRENRDVLRNQDLAKAAARAISLALGKISYQSPEIQGQLQHLASQTEAYWLQWEEQAQTEQAQKLTLFESVREEQLVNIFAQSPEQFSQYQVLQLREWRELATWLFRQGCQQGALLGELADYKDVIDALAQELQQNFNKNLREVLKDDAKNGGEAFAGMLLDLHSKTLAKLDNLEQEIKQEFQKLATREDICQALERVESGIHQELQEIKAMLVVVLELLHQRGNEQEGEQPPNLQSFDVLPMQPPLSLLCPYLGLSAFRQEDKHLFFGRDELIEDLVEAVESGDIVPVIGPSGSGKSSVVFAGLMPELEKKSGWLIESLRPKKDPLHELARALLRLTAPETELQEENINAPIVAQRLRNDPLTLEKWLGSLLERQREKRILLVIDQFEEVFPTAERGLFLQQVLVGVKALNQRSLRVTLLFTMRADFMEEALSEPRLAEVLDGDVKVKPMNAEQLRAVIEKPAQGLVQIEEGLTGRILGDLLTEKDSSSEQTGEPAGCLPLVEFALEKLWQEHERGWLTHEAYDKIGGVKGAIAQHAESVFQGLDSGEQETVRQLLIQLVYPGVENRHTRKIVTSAELGEQQWSMAQELAREKYRLVVTKRNQGTETVELIHEALIREWGRLRGWIKDDGEFRRWQEQLEVERKSGDLLQGNRLSQAEMWLHTRGGELSKDQIKFIRESIEKREKTIQEREKQRRRVVQGAVALGGLMTVLAAAAGLFGVQAERRRVEAELRADALFAQRLVELRPVPALTRAIAATGSSEQKLGQVLPLVQTSLAETVQVSRERQQFQGHKTSIALTPDGSKVIFGSQDGTLRVWDITTGDSLAVLEGHQDTVTSIAITPDGSQVISGSRDNTLRVWDITTGDSLAVLEGHQDYVTSLAITPDGSKIISGSSDNTLRVWDITTGESLAVLEGHQDWVRSIAITPDGSKVISGSSDNTLRVWDMATGESLAVLKANQGGVYFISITPDGSKIISDGGDGNCQVWDISTGKSLAVLECSQNDMLHPSAITPDGSKVISGSEDDTVRVLDITTGQSLAVLEGHQESVTSVAITPDGSKVISGSRDQTLRVWDISTGDSLAVLKGHQDEVYLIAITPDGSKVVSRSRDNTVRVWDIARGESLAILEGHQDWVYPIAITPDGSKVISGSGDNTLRVWDIATGESLALLEGHQGSVNSIAITPDGSKVISGSDDSTLRVWDIATGESLAVLEGHQGYQGSIAITPDGSKVISGSLDNTLRVWDINTGESLAVLEGHQSVVTSIAITHDGSKVISGSWYREDITDSTVRVWDMATGESLALLEGHQGWVGSIAITPDGSKVISGGWDNTVRVWDIATGESLAVLEGHHGWVWSIAITPDGSKVISGGEDNTLRVWDIATGESLAVLEGHQSWVWSLAITPDGSKVISGSEDTTLRVWDIATGESLAVLEGHQDSVTSIAITPDRSKIISGSADGTLRIWPATWQGWLEVGCNRMRFHSSWVRATLEPPSEEREITLEAIRTCERLVWSDRSIAELRIQQGLAVAEAGDTDGAKKLWQESRRLDEAVYEQYEERLEG